MFNPGLIETKGCLCLASRRAARRITRDFDRALRPHGLRSTQFSALAVLTLAGPKTTGELAAILSADRTTMTRNLAVLEQRGLLEIRRGKDARERIAEVTGKGREALNAAFLSWRKTQSTILESMGGETADSLRALAWAKAA
ncbi:MAG: winged helix-turn-helix transcriptional regulator [Maricaulaceae bacterium]|nr:winged helix-turn-helix transcriptional regulator [Maricaulaceae bacterium]